MKKSRILYILNSISETSIPFEWAIALNKLGWDISVLPVENNNEELYSINYDLPFIKMKRYSRGNPFSILEIYNVIKKNNINLIHIHSNYSGALASLSVFLNKKIHVVNSEHSPAWAFNKLGLILDTFSLARADYNCFNSQYTKESLYPWQKKIIKNIPSKIIYNGVPITRIQQVVKSVSKDSLYDKWNLSKEDFNIACIATFKKQKDHSTLLKAIQLLKNSYPRIKLLLIGDGVLFANLKKQVSDLGITKQVHFLGLLSRNEVYQLFKIIEISLMTSYVEGFCNAIVESMAAKIPAIVSDIPTLNEVVGEAGIYFKVGDYMDLAKKLKTLMGNKSERKRYGNLGYKRCIELFDNEKNIKMYEEIYDSLLSHV